ncbi:urease accessory protein [Hymenobacter sp. HSC-4F20]|uniref:urease accessory protein n=1 Tax=Hymenobacter sp. HSC-4F20 TaxID=2864135 RepID=UPI001C731BF7|nr:urease accessory protein [Hymenobacter sp. HSC-4F20]MBX0292401.1 urease accessory protein [Hymenobacter sp. HSC-4F20]
MHDLLPIAFAFLAGMGHAFEADHLIAVSTLVARHDSRLRAVQEGLFWGLGHTTTLVVFGGALLLSRALISHSNYFEAAVGLMLLVMGLSRLTDKSYYQTAPPRYRRGTAYAVGLVHGLAGSGALVLLLMGSLKNPWLGVAYLLLFGLGSVLGMLGATGLMSIPFTQRMRFSRNLRAGMVVASALLSIGYGGWMVYGNLFGAPKQEPRTQTRSTPPPENRSGLGSLISRI